jgi:hypothetical protein
MTRKGDQHRRPEPENWGGFKSDPEGLRRSLRLNPACEQPGTRASVTGSALATDASDLVETAASAVISMPYKSTVSAATSASVSRPTSTYTREQPTANQRGSEPSRSTASTPLSEAITYTPPAVTYTLARPQPTIAHQHRPRAPYTQRQSSRATSTASSVSSCPAPALVAVTSGSQGVPGPGQPGFVTTTLARVQPVIAKPRRSSSFAAMP